MVHLHMQWPHWVHWRAWAEQTFSEAEQEGPIQMLGFLFAVTIMLAAFLLVITTLFIGVG